MLKAFLNAFGFLSIIPIGMPDSYEDVADRMYLFPLVGAVLGLLAGLFLTLISLFFPASVAGSLGLFVLLCLTGLQHLDGLLDLGDAIIYRGSREKRIEVMHRPGNGVGGFATGLFVTLSAVFITIEYISAGGRPIILFIAGESMGKLAMVISAGLGTPAFRGMGSIFVERVNKTKWQILISVLLGGLVLSPITGWLTPVLISIAALSSIAFIYISKRLIGGLSGDVFGAINEVTRMLIFLVMLWML